MHRLTVGSIPRSITIVLQDDLVDRCKAGDDVTIVGLLRKRWKPPQRDQRVEVEMAIEAASLRVHNEERGTDAVREDLAADFAQYWSEHANESLRARDWLLRCLCPGLADLYIVKLALALCLIGGVGNIDRTGMRTRGEAHMLLVGDAGTGKSQVLRYAAKLSSRAVLTTGMGSTSAGLTCTAVRDPGGEWMLEAGALVLADGARWVPIEDVRVGDWVYARDADGQIVLRQVTDEIVTQDAAQLFLTIEHEGGRFETISTTDEHPFWIEGGRGFVRADELSPGDVLKAATGQSIVQGLSISGERTTVYNLTVDDAHTYLVGPDGVWVHNAECLPYPLTRNNFRPNMMSLLPPPAPGYHAHHVIPHEWQHLFTKNLNDPRANGAWVRGDVHIREITAEWNRWRNKKPNRTASEVLRFKKYIDRQYAAYLIIPGR